MTIINKGLPHFLKAQRIYQIATSINTNNTSSVVHNINRFLRDCTMNDKYGLYTNQHVFYINGVIDFKLIETNYTLTLFYMAQVYTKLKHNDKAVTY